MNPLVTPSWLARRLDDPDTVILDASLAPVGVAPPVDTRARYIAEHIPGAIFFDIDELSDKATSLPHMLPSDECFSRSMAALGVSEQKSIVIYEQQAVFSAPRAWWMLRTVGAERVFVLDGDLSAWVQMGLPTEAGEVLRQPALFTARRQREAVKDLAQVQAMIARGEQIVDARSAARFAGAAPEPRPGISSGHMPGSTSIPFTDLVTGGRLQSADHLRALFAARGVRIDLPVTTTCGSGVTAAVLALGLEIAGAGQVSLYDGSWAEYAQHPGAVIEKNS